MSQMVRTAVIAGSFLVGSVILALLARWVQRSVLRRLYRRTESDLDDMLFKSLEGPVTLAIVALGLYGAALTILHSSLMNRFPQDTVSHYIAKTNQVSLAVATLIVSFGLLRLFNSAARWYSTKIGPSGFAHQVQLLKKVLNFAAWAVIIVLVLAQLGYKVNALMATLGIGGLAVALALQDTLSNVFAGFYTMADKSVKIGDYIKLESGEEGFVEEVGWRNTRIRLWANNMVLVPNSKLIQSIVTNYTMPEHQLSVYVSCGVSYSSDLDEVERVTIETAKHILQTVPGAVEHYEPVVRFKEFGDSNINFLVVLRARDVASQYLLHHEFVKALHRRYREEGIEINYPVRVIVPAGDGAPPDSV